MVKESVPIEFELKRAKALLDEIIPDMHANIRLIAQEEVEIAALQASLDRGVRALDEEKERIGKLSTALAVERTHPPWSFNALNFSRLFGPARAKQFRRYTGREWRPWPASR